MPRNPGSPDVRDAMGAALSFSMAVLAVDPPASDMSERSYSSVWCAVCMREAPSRASREAKKKEVEESVLTSKAFHGPPPPTPATAW